MAQSLRPHPARRRFLAALSGLPAYALAALPSHAGFEAPPETQEVRLEEFPSICLAPMLLAEEILHSEGFKRVTYVKNGINAAIGGDHYDIAMATAPALIAALDAGDPLVAIAGVHAGCQELFGNARVPEIRHLKGKSVAISARGSGEHVFVSSVASYVGIDPKRDITWIVAGSSEAALQQFADGKADAFLAFEPQSHILHTRGIGHVILNTTEDRPWSQYFCCILYARREFVHNHPVATRRALRALLKATDLCADQPERAARHLVDRGHEPNYDLAMRVLKSLPYRRWRDANPADTLRFHALRLHEGGVIAATPNHLVEHGCDWRFLEALKRELKA